LVNKIVASETVFSNQRSFKRGEIFNVDFGGEKKKIKRDSCVISGTHRAIVLFDSEFPRNTVVVLPITSLFNKKGIRKKTIMTDVILKKKEYIGQLSKDSFVMTNQVQSVTRNRLEDKKGELTPIDMFKVDLQLIETLSLKETIQNLVEEQVEKRLVELGYNVENELDA